VHRFRAGDEVYGLPYFPAAAGANAEYLVGGMALCPSLTEVAEGCDVLLCERSRLGAVRRSRRLQGTVNGWGALFETP
jgi:hypothetical protein